MLQEAVEKLLQAEEDQYGEPDHEIYDKEFFGFTYGNYGKLLSQSFAWLPRTSSTVHPMPTFASKLTSRHSLRFGSTGSKVVSCRRLSVASRVASAPRLNTPSTAWSAQKFGCFSRESSQHKLSMQSITPSFPMELSAHHPNSLTDEGMSQALSMHSTGLFKPKHHLPARRASILKLNTGDVGHSAQQHALPKRFPSALTFGEASNPSSTLSRRSSWLSLSQNSVYPHMSAEPTLKHLQSKRSVLRFGASVSPQHTPDQPAEESDVLSACKLQLTRSVLRSRSSVTAASLFNTALDVSSSEDDGSQAVPDELIESAMFLLRDKTLADPQAEVSCIAWHST